MERFKDDFDLFKFIRENLYVAAVCDILDEMGYWHQAMHHRLRPLLPDMRKCGFVGRARTISWIGTDKVIEDDPYGLEIEAIDSLQAGDVVVHSTDFKGTNAPWGELMSTIAKKKGVHGCVCDSQIRDCVKIIDMGFPVFYTGIRPLNSKGRGIVTDYDNEITCGDVLVNSGDLMFADFDGIVVVPKTLEQEVFEAAAEKVHSENLSRGELLNGQTLRAVYERYKTL